MRFDQEIWMYCLLILPLIWLVIRASDRGTGNRLRVLLGDQAKVHVEGANPRLRSWRRFLFFCGLFFLIIALARPQWGASEVTVVQRGSDIVIALDISNSMMAEDVTPNRMERAKAELANFLARVQDSRVGLVFFAGAAFIQCPLTLDYGTTDIFLNMAGPDMMSEQGTAIGSALSTSRELLAKGREGAPQGTFQAILLVTDGEDLEGNWEAEAEACRDEGIRLIPVGVGEESGGLIPVLDDQGRSAGFMKDDSDNVVLSRLDLASLEKIAGIGGGSSFRIGVDGLAGDRLFAELQRLGQRDLEERKISAYQERYMWPMLLAFICFAVQQLLRARNRNPDERHRQVRVLNSLAVLVVVLASLGTNQALAGLRPDGATEAEAGQKKYLAGNYEEALIGFESALAKAPDDPLVSLAVGETLFQLQEYEQALQEFERTVNLTEDPTLRAEALYNAGTTLLASGDLPKAIDKLRESLAVESDRQDALHNLEVAMRRLQQQQQQQQEQQQQNKDDQEQKEEQEQEQQQEQDQEQQEQEEQQQEEQEQDEQEQEQEEQQQQEQEEQQPEETEQSEPEESEPEPEAEEELTRDQAMQILRALDRDEEELKRSVQKRLKGGKPRSGKKW